MPGVGFCANLQFFALRASLHKEDGKAKKEDGRTFQMRMG
jgi:hypothetical protein